jgi:hypothetical protein
MFCQKTPVLVFVPFVSRERERESEREIVRERERERERAVYLNWARGKTKGLLKMLFKRNMQGNSIQTPFFALFVTLAG